MDVLLNALEDSKFVKVSNYSKLCVVNCVPGSGKSSLIRRILKLDSRFTAYTFGVEDPKSEGFSRIKSICSFQESNKLVIIDEYTQGDISTLKPCCVFGDPNQSVYEGLEPNFICEETKRFGKQTCELLRSFNFKIFSNKNDTVQIGDPFVTDPEGTLISIGSEAHDLATSHGLKPLKLEEFRGITCDIITLLTSENTIPDDQRAEFYVALTRHRTKLLILCPNAIFCSSRQL
nr:triple gene block protein 1 [Carrot virus S]